MKTNVLFLYPSTFLAPSWEICKQIGRHLDADRFGKFAAIDNDADDPGVGEAQHVHVDRFAMGSAMAKLKHGDIAKSLDVLRTAKGLVKSVTKNRIDVIHSSDDGGTMLLALMLARATRTKLLIHYHTIPSMYSGARLEFSRRVARLADLNVGVSRFVAEDVHHIGVDPRKIAAVHNGADFERFHPRNDGSGIRREFGIADDDVLCLQLARIWQPKRQEDFVRAIAIARKSEPKLRGLIIGWEDPRYSGTFASYKTELLDIARREGLGEALIIAPARRDAPNLHAAADISVLPSINEPFGLVVVEAMATGKPVVAARSGGIVEIIEDGRTGYLVEPRSPAVLAEKLVLLARDASLRQTIGEAARASVVSGYGEARVAERFAPVYEAVAQGSPVPASERL